MSAAPGYSLGIDLGTTFTSAAIWRDGRAEIVNLGDRSASIPSVLFAGEDGTLAVGAVDTAGSSADHEPLGTRSPGDTAPVEAPDSTGEGRSGRSSGEGVMASSQLPPGVADTSDDGRELAALADFEIDLPTAEDLLFDVASESVSFEADVADRPDSVVEVVESLPSSFTTRVDADGDGVAEYERTRFDRDGDGGVDRTRISVDSDDDGVVDGSVTFRLDDDGDVKSTFIDEDGDGKIDSRRYDYDGDGEPDRIVTNERFDFDGDGDTDYKRTFIDKDGDGDPERILVDRDGDGRPDKIYDVGGSGSAGQGSVPNFGGAFEEPESVSFEADVADRPDGATAQADTSLQNTWTGSVPEVPATAQDHSEAPREDDPADFDAGVSRGSSAVGVDLSPEASGGEMPSSGVDFSPTLNPQPEVPSARGDLATLMELSPEAESIYEPLVGPAGEERGGDVTPGEPSMELSRESELEPDPVLGGGRLASLTPTAEVYEQADRVDSLVSPQVEDLADDITGDLGDDLDFDS